MAGALEGFIFTRQTISIHRDLLPFFLKSRNLANVRRMDEISVRNTRS